MTRGEPDERWAQGGERGSVTRSEQQSRPRTVIPRPKNGDATHPAIGHCLLRPGDLVLFQASNRIHVVPGLGAPVLAERLVLIV